MVPGKIEDVLREFHREARIKFGVANLNLARVRDLEVYVVDFPFEVRRVDGKERIVDVRNQRAIAM